MEDQVTRSRLSWLLWANLATLGCMLLLQIAVGSLIRWSAIPKVILIALIYCNTTAVPAVLLFPPILCRAFQLRWPLVPIVGIVSALLVAAGGLAGQGLVIALRLSSSQWFWKEYLSTLRLSLVIAVSISLGVFLYQSMRAQLRQATKDLHEKQLAEERALKLAAEARLASLESRIRPHFLFNTLNSISALIPSDPGHAEEMIGRLARLLRSSLEIASEPLVPLAQELQMIRDYVDIEKARLGEKLQGRIEVPLEMQTAQIPPLSLQCLVENAIKYGIAPQRTGGEFLIAACEENGGLRIEVSDSGPGFDLSAIRSGHGLDNLVSRLDALFGDKARLNVLRRDGRCVVEMVLPR